MTNGKGDKGITLFQTARAVEEIKSAIHQNRKEHRRNIMRYPIMLFWIVHCISSVRKRPIQILNANQSIKCSVKIDKIDH